MKKLSIYPLGKTLSAPSVDEPKWTMILTMQASMIIRAAINKGDYKKQEGRQELPYMPPSDDPKDYSEVCRLAPCYTYD